MNKDESWGEYLIVGKKWAVQSVNPQTEGDILPLEKYISINSIMKQNIFSNQRNQIVVTIDICTPHASVGGQYHVAIVTLNQSKENYEIYSEYYTIGRTFAPSVAIDIDNDGLMEIALFQGIWWGHPWGYKYLNILKGENNSLLNIMETIANSFNNVLDTKKGTVSETYEATIEIDQYSISGYNPIIKTGLKSWVPQYSTKERGNAILLTIKVDKEIFVWNGKKYISSGSRVLLKQDVSEAISEKE